MPYNLNTHRRNFAIWAAARATQRGLGSIDQYRHAIESASLMDFVDGYDGGDVTPEAFKEMHLDWCRSILNDLRAQGLTKARFGRAAKLVAMYLKTSVVLGGQAESPLARIAYPPIDGILLDNLAESTQGTEVQRRAWDAIKWTKLDEDAFYALVRELRAIVPAAEPFWKLEEFWTVTTEQ